MSFYPAPTPVNLEKEETQALSRLNLLTELAVEEAEKAEGAGKEIKTIINSIKNGYFTNIKQLLEPLEHVLETMGEAS